MTSAALYLTQTQPPPLRMASPERRVSAAELRSFCAALVAAPELRMSKAASTSARAPARVVVRFCAAPAAGGPPVELPVAVRELEYADGGLGFRLFPAALWLAAWLAARPAWISGATVLELGAGLGLVGLAAAKQGAAVTLSDFNPGLLSALAAAAKDNGVAATVAACDWADEAAERAAPAAGKAAGSASADIIAAFDRDANPEYYRVRAQLASSSRSDGIAERLPAGASYDIAVASEVLYEAHAAAALPALLSRRLKPGGRFVTLMAVRDVALVETFCSRCRAFGMKVALRRIADVALPPGDAAEAAQAAAEAAAAKQAGRDAPMCGGEWCSDAEWRALLASGGAGGGPLEAAWLEARQPMDAPPPRQQEGPCCSRRARGMACPCAARAAVPPRAPPAAQPG
jgi:predicted nicotinamide N-methyase